MTLVDVHCHLDASAYHDVTTVCQQSRQAGVSVTVAAGTGLQSNARILALQEQEPGQVWAALGLHPERRAASWEELEAVIAQVQEHRARIVALGEIGLPHYALDNRMTPEQAQEREAMLHALVQAVVRFDLPDGTDRKYKRPLVPPPRQHSPQRPSPAAPRAQGSGAVSPERPGVRHSAAREEPAVLLSAEGNVDDFWAICGKCLTSL